MRISERLLVQAVDGVGIVVVDESSGNEVVVPVDTMDRLAGAVAYFKASYGIPDGMRPVPHVPNDAFARADTVTEVLGQLAGAASVCWETPGGAGVFQSDLAWGFVQQAEERILDILDDDD